MLFLSSNFPVFSRFLMNTKEYILMGKGKDFSVFIKSGNVL